MKYLLLLAIVFQSSSCSAQIRKAKQVLVFKVEHTNSKYYGYYYTSYSLIDLEKIKGFNIIDNDSISSPNITYYITANGGNVIIDPFIDFETFGCCEYGDVEQAVEEHFAGNIPKEKMNEYSNVNELSLDVFSDDNSVNFLFKEGRATYKVKVWLAELEYCVCGIYMGSPQHDIYEKKVARIKSINAISKPNQKLKKEIEVILKKLIEIDIKHQP